MKLYAIVKNKTSLDRCVIGQNPTIRRSMWCEQSTGIQCSALKTSQMLDRALAKSLLLKLEIKHNISFLFHNSVVNVWNQGS